MISFCGTVSKAFVAKSCDVSFDRHYYLDFRQRKSIDGICQKYVNDCFGDQRIIFGESNLADWRHCSSDCYTVGGIQPNMLLGMLLGAEFITYPDKDADISNECLAEHDIDNLPAPQSLLDHELIRKCDSQIHECQELGLQVIPPFFWDCSGVAAIHGPLTTAQKFIGEKVFLDMMALPVNVHKILNWIMKAYIVLCEHFADIAQRTIDCIHIGECSACMVNAELFERFIIPAISLMDEHISRIRLHSCGSSTHLISSCAKIGHLSELDLGGQTSILMVRKLFGKNFPVTISPIPEMLMADSSQPIGQWLEKISQENDGGKITINCHIEPEYKIANIKEIIRVVDLPLDRVRPYP